MIKRLTRFINRQTERLEQYTETLKQRQYERNQYQLGYDFAERTFHEQEDPEWTMIFLDGLLRFHTAEQNEHFRKGIMDFLNWLEAEYCA